MTKISPAPKKKKKKKKVVKTPEQIRAAKKEAALKRRKKVLHNNVLNIFMNNMGFQFLKTDGIHKIFAEQMGELDNIFVYENIVLMVEETISPDDKEHIRKKYIYFQKIREELPEFLKWLRTDYETELSVYDEYGLGRYKFYYIYICDDLIDDQTRKAFSDLIFIDKPILNYFSSISSSIKLTSRFELFKFLGLELSDLKSPEASEDLKKIETTVVLPESASGFPEGVQVLTFIMKASDLLECSYVLRKDSWDNTIGLYQRLIEKKRIDEIRSFLANKKRTFIDNIIVSLPFDTTFSIKDIKTNQDVNFDVFKTQKFSNVVMTIPYKLNSIGIIDGQHRIFSHYEGTDTLEAEIFKLRNKRHLFVTGLFFDKKLFNDDQKRKLESEIFLQINSTQKKVSPALLHFIKSLNDPSSSIGIANNVILSLNKVNPFLGLFSISSLEKGGIKIPSILQYGLQNIIELEPDDVQLYTYYIKEGNIPPKDGGKLQDYVRYCTDKIQIYFCAVRAIYKDQWFIKNKKGGILSSTAIVGFLRAFKISLNLTDGPQDFDYYKDKFKVLDVNFKDYTSSHWNALADEIVKQAWGENNKEEAIEVS
ncbi:DGQHR domain-containing protein [Siphonobacter curvatus]|uniref:DGQHR domain-containing protein n=1 Tax=Siphonobacter curvatus TaxID=2094562 RepID=A0A2S7IR10_9BACT|nr:DGQHR domain-containing protein [Siphonobacter curvatus]PQA60144.1 hypothetical protein C5O19_11155 [Siphonobacter curvatus]